MRGFETGRNEKARSCGGVSDMQSRFALLRCAIVLDEEVCLKVWIHVLLTVSPLG